MKSRVIITLALALLSLLFSTGCATKAKQENGKPPVVAGTHYTTVVFDKGKSSLSKSDKEFLKDLKKHAKKMDKGIDEIRILAWADQEYPETSDEKAPKHEIELATERAQKIKDYLECDLKTLDDIDSFNMAKRPNLVSQMFQSDDYKIKNAFEQSGATACRLPDGSVSYTKASKALVIIDYEGDEDDFQ